MIVEATVLALASAATELLIVLKIPIVKQIVSKYVIGSIVFSTALSWLLGWIFAATGVTVLVSAIVSTLMTTLAYKGLKLLEVVIDKTRNTIDLVVEPMAQLQGADMVSTSV